MELLAAPYELRAATAECDISQAQNSGLERMPVRGLGKILGVAMLFALAHHLMRTPALALQLLGLGRIPSAQAACTVRRAKPSPNPDLWSLRGLRITTLLLADAIGRALLAINRMRSAVRAHQLLHRL